LTQNLFLEAVKEVAERTCVHLESVLDSFQGPGKRVFHRPEQAEIAYVMRHVHAANGTISRSISPAFS
jgi:hypothetical protein